MFATDISSTSAGGNWNVGSTWIGGGVPGSNDNVTINGPVLLNIDTYCQNLTLTASGILRNYSSNVFSIIMEGSLVNNGSLGSNPDGGILNLYCLGNLANNGNLNPYNLYFSGDVDQNISGTASINALRIYDNQPASRLILASDLSFTGAIISLDYNTIVMGNAAQNYNLSVSGGYLTNATVDGDAGDRITLLNGSYLSWVNADEIELWGDNIMLAECQFGILHNRGTLRNWSNSNYNLTVTERLENYGTIEDNPNGGYLFLYLAGDLYNHGSFTNYQITIQNPVRRNIWQSPTAQPFGWNFVYSSASYGGLQALSDLSFAGCQIFMDSAYLLLEQEEIAYGITLQGGFLNGAVLYCAPTSFLECSGNAFLTNTSIDQMVWRGTVCVAVYVEIGRLVNMGTLYNYSNSNYTLTVGEYLENRGTIADNPAAGLLIVNLNGDLYDYASISNYQFVFNNTAINSLYQSPEASAISCDYFTSAGSSAGHRLLSDLRFSACTINFGDHSLDLAYLQNGYVISVQGGYLMNAVIHGGSTASLNLGGNAYLYNVNADEISFQGTVLVANYVTVGILRNLGTLQNYYNNNYLITVQTRLENQGSISSNPSGGLLVISLYGDLQDYGSLDIYVLYLNKPGTMELFQSATASPIKCGAIDRLPSSGDIQLRSEFRCENTAIQMHSNRILTHNGRASYGMKIQGGYLDTTTLVTNGYTSLELSNNAYLYQVSAGDMILKGDVLVTGNCSFASIVNYGTLRNHWTNVYVASCSGDLVNYGTISNHPSGGLLYFYCAADISNYGSIQNNTTYLESANDQYLLNRGTISGGPSSSSRISAMPTGFSMAVPYTLPTLRSRSPSMPTRPESGSPNMMGIPAAM